MLQAGFVKGAEGIYTSTSEGRFSFEAKPHAVLGSPTEDQRFQDAAALLDWGFAQP